VVSFSADLYALLAEAADALSFTVPDELELELEEESSVVA
jgi:hypothetical protein